MEKIRIKSKNEYVIEVNDNGDTISFDLSDPELMLKFDRAFNKVKEIEKVYHQKEKEINEREIQDEIVEGILTNTEREIQDEIVEGILTNTEREIQEFAVKCFKDMRNAFDEFLGKNGCQKIFGDKNYVSMYDDLIEALEPHFEKMGLNAKKLKNEVVDKYKDKDEEVL